MLYIYICFYIYIYIYIHIHTYVYVALLMYTVIQHEGKHTKTFLRGGTSRSCRSPVDPPPSGSENQTRNTARCYIQSTNHY